jgi:hypothetical protein
MDDNKHHRRDDNYGDQAEDTAHLSCTACGGSGHIDDQLTRQGQAGRFAWAAFAKNGNVIIWSHRRDQVKQVAARYSTPVKPVIVLHAEGTAAARDVLAERRRQVEKEGWTPEHDDQHGECSMSYAAACYALEGTPIARTPTVNIQRVWEYTGWSWLAWWKPKDRRRNLVRAAALILADIERIDRAMKTATNEGEQKGGAA